MKRSIEKGIAEGRKLMKDRDRINMDMSELLYFVNELEAENDTGISDTIYNSFLFGVAIGHRISTKPRRTATK